MKNSDHSIRGTIKFLFISGVTPNRTETSISGALQQELYQQLIVSMGKKQKTERENKTSKKHDSRTETNKYRPKTSISNVQVLRL